MPASTNRRLQLLPIRDYTGVNRDDPIRFYGLPVIGNIYRRRVELCLEELTGGDRILEVGFGSGVCFYNLKDLYGTIYGLDLTASTQAIEEFYRQHGIQTILANGSVLEMPYPENHFDSVLLISILEHLKPDQLDLAFSEIIRVLKPGGQVVYGVPVERPLMVFLFRLLGYNIHEHHFSTEKDVRAAALRAGKRVRMAELSSPGRLLGSLYEVGHFIKV